MIVGNEIYMKLPSPQDLGMPSRYEHWRTVQEEAISVTVTQYPIKRVVASQVPTGGGKSGHNEAIALLHPNVATCIVTDSRGLQDQYMREGAEIGMTDLRGRANYECGMKDGYTCEEGYNSRCPYQGSMRCPSSKAEMRFGVSKLGVTNYAKWTAGKRANASYLSHFQQVIFDEAHVSPLALAKIMQIVLHHREVEKTLDYPFPDVQFSKKYDPEDMAKCMQVWKTWAESFKPKVEEEMRRAKAKVEAVKDPKRSLVTHYMHMKELNRRLGILRLASPKNWVVDTFKREDGDWGYQFDPIRPGRYTEALLFGGADHVILTSATLNEKCLRLLGLKRDDYFYREFDSTFDPLDCPIYYVPTAKIDSRSTPYEISLQFALLDRIISGRRDRNGGVHTISYLRQAELLKSRWSNWMYYNEKGEPATRIIEDFKQAEAGSILVSPSFGTGYDFPGIAMEWQFLWKVPFEPPSKIVQARDHDDHGEYRGYRAANLLEQMAGRINRDDGDRGETFIGDLNMEWFKPRFSKFFSKNFHNRFQRVGVVPQPLLKMGV